MKMVSECGHDWLAGSEAARKMPNGGNERSYEARGAGNDGARVSEEAIDRSALSKCAFFFARLQARPATFVLYL